MPDDGCCPHARGWHQVGWSYTHGEFTHGSTGPGCMVCLSEFFKEVEAWKALPRWRRLFVPRPTAVYEHQFKEAVRAR